MSGIPSGPTMTGQMRRFVHDLRTEGSGPGRDATAVGLGVFIGSLPFYGFHLAICLAAGTLLRLNRVKLYLAANISNPFMAPFLILSELQAGSLVRRGELRPLTIEAVKQINPWSLGADILIGSVIVGAVLGLAIGSATWLLTRDPEKIRFSPRSCDGPRIGSSPAASRRGSSRAASSAGIRCIGRF